MNQSITTYRLQYATTRREVWSWYWRAWARPAGLWRFHCLIGVSAALGVAEARGFAKSSWQSIAAAAAMGMAFCIALFPLWPQIKFKPQVRTLELDAEGFRTAIGRIQGERRWSEIRSVHDDGETIVLTARNGNAMLIPRRAFADADVRGKFISDVKGWHVRSAT